MTKLRFYSVVLVAVFGVFILAAAARIVAAVGMSDGGGF